MYSSYGYGYSSSSDSNVWLLVSLILAVIGGIVVYFTLLNKKNEGKFNGFLGWLYNFLTFKLMLAEMLLKILYLILALFVTLSSFSFIGLNFLVFLLYLVLGNVIVRIIYEFLLISLVICRNTTEINQKLGKTVTIERKDEDKD